MPSTRTTSKVNQEEKFFFSVIFNVLDDNDMHVYWRFLTSVDFPINVESRSMTTCNREGTKPRVRVLSPLCSLHSEETEWIASHRIAHHDSSVSYLRKFHSSPNIILRRPKSLVLLNSFLCDFCFFFLGWNSINLVSRLFLLVPCLNEVSEKHLKLVGKGSGCLAKAVPQDVNVVAK